MARYRLLIKRENRKKALDDEYKPLSFSVIDLDRGNYPLNWVCNLPRDATGLFRNSKFSSLFTEKDSASFAIRLLKQAKKTYDDQAILEEIDNRISKIQDMKTEESSRYNFRKNLSN